MFTAKRIESTIEPQKFESLNNGTWYYNYDIKSEEVQVPEEMGGEELTTKTIYNYVQVRISGKPTYDKCVKALIRAHVDTNEELDLINSYNAYQLDVTTSDPEYEAYLELLKTVKQNVRKDFNKEASTSTSSKPKQADIMKLMLMTINTMELTDQQALSVRSLYPEWETLIGQELTEGLKLQYDGKLFKVVKTHTAQETWKPVIDTASLYTEIVEDHAGTLEDPIPYPADGNMVISNGKYYIENGITYKCIRDSGVPLYTALANVVGNYVQKV